VKDALVVWRLLDGKPGHEKQSLGLLQGLAALAPVAAYEIDMRSKSMFWGEILRHVRGEAMLPPPHLIVGVGHATHLPMLAARAACGGRTVVLMKPSLPPFLFDLIFVPRHDHYPDKSNVDLPDRRSHRNMISCHTLDLPREAGYSASADHFEVFFEELKHAHPGAKRLNRMALRPPFAQGRQHRQSIHAWYAHLGPAVRRLHHHQIIADVHGQAVQTALTHQDAHHMARLGSLPGNVRHPLLAGRQDHRLGLG